MIGQEIKINGHQDERGFLMAVNHIPFDAKRMFIISDVPEGAIRGNHFSKTSGFLYLVIKGGCKVELDNGHDIEIHELNTGDGLFFQKNTWIKLYGFQKETILSVLADNVYSSSDYVSNYEEFKKIVREKNV